MRNFFCEFLLFYSPFFLMQNWSAERVECLATNVCPAWLNVWLTTWPSAEPAFTPNLIYYLYLPPQYCWYEKINEESFKHENLTFDADISQSKVDMNAELDAHTLMKSRTSSKLLIREGFKKSKWKFKMAFAIRRPTPPPPPLMAKFPDIFLPHFFSFAIESYIYETDFTLQKYHF